MIPIFCINLTRAQERKNFIQKEWIEKLNFNIIFWPAYDRRDVVNNKFIYPYDKKLSIKNYGRELNAGEIACATSFAQLMKYCIDNNIHECIVMEDDIIPNIFNKEELFQKIIFGQLEFPECQMFLLHGIPSFYKQKDHDEIFYMKKSYFSLCKKAPVGNQMFFIKKPAINILYEKLITMYYPADIIQKKFLVNNNLVCISNKPVCFHDLGPNSATYIGNDIRNTHRYKFIP